MLNVLRDNLKNTPLLKYVLLLVGLGLVAYLGNYFVSDSSGGVAASWVARVNGRDIPDWRLRDSARNLDNYYRQMFGDGYDNLRGQIPLREQALQSLIERELILQDARRIGLVGDDDAIAKQIVEHPGLQGADGSFIGRERYEEVIARSYTGGVRAFENGLREDQIVAQWQNLVSQPVDVSDGELERRFRERTEKTAIDFTILSTDDVTPAKLDDAAVRAWYDEHQDDYRLDEGRAIRYVVVDRDAQKAAVDVTDEEIAADYEANRSRYEHPDQRQASHILFRAGASADEAATAAARGKAEAALARARAGEDFAALARELSEDPSSAVKGGDLGFFGSDDMVEPFAQAAFDTPVDELSNVVESPFGFHVILVTGARSAGVTPLDEVRDSIRQSLEAREADELVVAEAERLRGLIQSPAALAPVAETESLEVFERTVRADDRLNDIGASPDFIATVGTLDAGSVSRPLRLVSGMAIAVIDEALPATVAPFDDVRDRAREQAAAAALVSAAISKARAALDARGSVAAAAARLGLEVQSSGDLAPGQAIPAVGGSPESLRAELFGDAVAVGARGVIETPKGALIYEVTAREQFDPQRFSNERGELRVEMVRQKRAVYLQSLVNTLRGRQKIEVNYARAEAVVPVG